MSRPSLSPIPTPPRQRWRAFRTGALPALVFLGCVVAIAALWRGSAAAPTLVAEAETTRREIGAECAGTVTNLRVSLFQAVQAGEILGQITAPAPAQAEASLAVVRAEINALHRSLTAAVDQQRLNLDFHRLQLDWMRARTDLASLQVQLRQAEADLKRAAPLRERSVVSEESFEATRSLRDRRAAQVREQESLVERLAPAALPPASPVDEVSAALDARIRIQEEKLRAAELQLQPLPLVAPIDGIVTSVLRQEGEVVVAGQSILTVARPAPTHLVGYLRQPLPFQPEPGMVAEVRTRGPDRRSATTSVLAASPALERVPPTLLALLNRDDVPELGLRVHLTAPPSLRLRPGEQVDVWFARSGRSP
ncbi:MAG: hypothetical protein HZC55_02310 [Verrucomicrobia bacterium]|nr:hypothetical protein [Verrucomicrobiota bacterium]